MCGIAGFLTRDTLTADESTRIATTMSLSIRHRGPDDAGTWVDPTCGIALGHRRLAILDLTAAAHQPMRSRSGRYVVVFNGEIYNFLDLRRELEFHGFRFATRSDTEVLLAGFEQWGFVDTLRRAHGMFAIATWDTAERALFLARDRLGEKPLYYGAGAGGRALLFGSELKALVAHPGFTAAVDRDALCSFFKFGCVPGARSVYQGVRKLPAGCWLRLRGESDATNTPSSYWSLRAVAEDGLRHPFALSDLEVVRRCDTTLRRAVRRQMVSDVPLGAFLSGGIDSSIVAALMQEQSSRPVRTFTIGFDDATYNEAPYAAEVARHLGTDHTEAYVTSEDARSVIPDLPRLYDEPFGDSSQIPTLLVSRLARRHVVVSLSGDGGDELFGGYGRYALARRVWAVSGRLPIGFKRAVSALLARDHAGHGLGFVSSAQRPPTAVSGRFCDRARRLGEYASASSGDEFYASLLASWDGVDRLVKRGLDRSDVLALNERGLSGATLTERAMFADASTYLPDDILVKVDRAAMSVALETRVPFLDPEVVSFAWRVPLAQKVRYGRGKWILRRVLSRYLPPRLFDRPKRGFSVPIGRWLRGPLRSWAEDLLSESRLRREGYLDPAPVRKRWLEHLSGRRNWQQSLWFVLMWEAWLDGTATTRHVLP